MRWIVILLTALVLVGGAWTALWFVGAHEASQQIDAWLTSEDSQGRQWTCPNRAISGYPFALAVSCDKPTFSGHALGQSIQSSVSSLTASLAITSPRQIAVELRPPFAYRSSDGNTNLRGTWTNLTVDLDGIDDIHSVALTGSDVRLEGGFGPAGRQSMGSAGLEAHIGLPKAERDPTLDFDIAVAGTNVPQLDAIVGDTQSTDLRFVGRLDQADISDARTPEDVIDRWRRAGGHIDLTAARVSRGAAHVTGAGRLRLDEAHRPQGRIDAEFVGLQPILKRYGINANLAAAGNLLNALLGGNPKRAPSEPGAIALPINLLDGRLAVGPIRTEIALPPFY